MGEHRDWTDPQLRFERGQAWLRSSTDLLPKGWVRSELSVLSPGTEYRRLSATRAGPPRPAGYMALAPTLSGQWLLAPAPHGAMFDPNGQGVLAAPTDVAVEAAAVGRFQQIALLALDRVPPEVIASEDIVVLGSGPVAVGCVLELRRRGLDRIQVCSSRTEPPIAALAGIEMVDPNATGTAKLVCDATGTVTPATQWLADGGLLILLGTPSAENTLPAQTVHRRSWTVIGGHELTAFDPERYQAAYTHAVGWLARTLGRAGLADWCRRVPAREAPMVYADLLDGTRCAEPFVLWEWE